MPETVIVKDALEFFRTALIEAMARERVVTSAFTEYYLVNLLVSRVRYEQHPDVPLAELYCRAEVAPQIERIRLLRELGDSALALCGLWPQSASRPRHEVSTAYHMSIGRIAYHRLSTMTKQPVGVDVFAELSDRFIQFADVFLCVANKHALSDMRSILALYERWVQTGSSSAARLLAERDVLVGGLDSGIKH